MCSTSAGNMCFTTTHLGFSEIPELLLNHMRRKNNIVFTENMINHISLFLPKPFPANMWQSGTLIKD